MELPSKLLEEIAFNPRPKIEEYMLLVMDRNTHEEHLHQPLQTKNKKFKKAVTFLTVYNGPLKVTNGNSKFFFTKSLNGEDGFLQITIPQGAYEIKI